MSVKPIFLLSLPRSGSTLAQRILAAHPAVATASEPWLLLPLVYGLRADGVSAEYAHGTAAAAISDLFDVTPGARSAFMRGVREVATRVYEEASAGAEYFVDKTPRYHLIVDELSEVFPEAKYLVLLRNPLAVAASMIHTFTTDSHWNLYYHRIDLYAGVDNLIAASKRTDVDVHTVRYEAMVSSPEQTWRRVFEFLDLPFEPSVLTDFSGVQLRGRMGDPTGTKRYKEISRSSLAEWPATFGSPIRRRWAYRYLTWLGDERLAQLGYDRLQLREAVASAPLSAATCLQDLWFYPAGVANVLFDLSGLRSRLRTLWRGGRLYFRD